MSHIYEKSNLHHRWETSNARLLEDISIRNNCMRQMSIADVLYIIQDVFREDDFSLENLVDPCYLRHLKSSMNLNITCISVTYSSEF